MNALTSVRLLKSWQRRCTGAMRLALTGLVMLAGFDAFSQATVTTLTDANHGKPGYKDGNTFSAAQFRFPAGIALDPSDSNLLLADCTNNAIRLITSVGDKANSYTYSVYTNKDGINHPRAIAIDSATNIYVLNQGSGKDGTVLEFSGFFLFNYWEKYLVATNASHLTNATSLALDYAGNIYVTIQSNTVIRITQLGSNTVVGVITNRGTSLRGIVVMQNGSLALTDAGNNGIWVMDPNNTNRFNNATPFTGFKGAADLLGPPGVAAFNRPESIAKAGNGILVVADYNNAKVKTIDASGNVNLLYGVAPQNWFGSYPGWEDGVVSLSQVTVQARQPYGVAVAHNGTVYVTETYYDLLREATTTGLPVLPPPPPSPPTIYSVTTNFGQATLTWSPVSGATSYNVKRSSTTNTFTTIANTTATTYTDNSVANGATYYYVVSALNDGGESPNSDFVSATIPIPPPPSPVIGWYDYEGNFQTGFFSVLHPVSGTPFISYNDLDLAVYPNTGGIHSGVATYYTDDGSYPNATNGSTPPAYNDGQQ